MMREHFLKNWNSLNARLNSTQCKDEQLLRGMKLHEIGIQEIWEFQSLAIRGKKGLRLKSL